MTTKCISTGREVANDAGSVQFRCPNCGETIIVRSLNARKLATKYTCPSCGFEGPN